MEASQSLPTIAGKSLPRSKITSEMVVYGMISDKNIIRNKLYFLAGL